MSFSQSRRPKPRKPWPAKPFTDYPIALAFERIEFYQRVLEAHFERLGAPRREHGEAGSPREEKRAAARGQ